MTSRAKVKGSAFESLVRDYLRGAGIPAERIPAGMKDDRGDIAGVESWTLQVKCYADMQRAIRDGLADLEVQQANNDTPYGAVVVKRRGKADPGSQLVIIELWQLAALLLEQRNRRNVA